MIGFIVLNATQDAFDCGAQKKVMFWFVVNGLSRLVLFMLWLTCKHGKTHHLLTVELSCHLLYVKYALLYCHKYVKDV